MCVSRHASLSEVVSLMYLVYMCLWAAACARHLMCLKVACGSLYMHVFSKWHVCRE